MASFSELGIEVKSGKVRYSVLCPKCSHLRQKHKNIPCLTVNDEPDNQWWHCWNCDWQGNLGTMDKYNQVLEKSKMPKQIAETYSKEVREYWDSRGINMKIPKRHAVYEFSMAGKPILGFPTYMNHTLVDVKYLNTRWTPETQSPKWWNLKKEFGTRTLLWGIDKLNFVDGEPKVVTITEGHIDAMTWEQCEYKNATSVPSGAPNPDAQNFEHEFDYITDKYVQSILAEVELFIISTDSDAPGIKLRDHLALLLGKEKCKYVQYPVSYKDINEVYKGNEKKGLPALGKAGVDECYANLASFPLRGIVRPQDVRAELEMIASDGFT